ncbi:LamG domain-containing protein [Candidatus Poribacteria bacterium]|nr:LamG domain-containing protein [Candidatus Poribacteria bacterium]
MRAYRSGLAVLGFCVIASTASAALLDGVISVWTFNDGTAVDKYNRNNGKLMGAAKVAGGGKIGQAVDLNGKDAFVEVPHSASMDKMANAYTVSAWAKIRKGGDHSAIVFKGEKIGWGPNFLFRLATTSDTNLTWGACVAGVEGWFATDNAYKTNEWIHVAMTADGTKVTAYVNNKLPAATGGGSNPNPVKAPYLTFPTQPMRIGLGVGRGGDVNVKDYIDGQIDEVSIFSRALSAAEITQLGAIDFATPVEPLGKMATEWAALKSR